MTRSRTSLALFVIVALAVVAGCQVAPATPGSPSTPGAATPAGATATAAPGGSPQAKATSVGPATKAVGSLRVGTQAMAATADPNAILNGGGPGSEVAYAISDPLVAPNAEGELEPMLAESWSATATSWTFKLRPNVKFSNGQALTTADVKFTYDLTADPTNRYSAGSTWSAFTNEVKVIDPLTIEFVTKSPDALYAKRLDRMLIVPAAAYQQLGGAGFSQTPIGTGSYTLTNFTPNSLADLKASPATWRIPGVENLAFRGITDVATRNAALETGEINAAASLTPDNAAQARGAGKETVTFSTGATVLIYLDSVGDDAGPFTDIRVRRAVSLALDRQGVVSALTGEFGLPANQAVTKGVFGYDASLPPLPMDVNEARRLVTEAGAAGTRLGMQGAFGVGTGLTSSVAAQAVAASISRSGLQVDLETIEAATFVQRFRGGGLGPIGMASLPSGIDADGALQWFRGTDLAPAAVRFSNPTYDQLFRQSTQEFDERARERQLQQMLKILNDEVGVVPFGAVPFILAHDGTITNISVTGAYRWNFAVLRVKS